MQNKRTISFIFLIIAAAIAVVLVYHSKPKQQPPTPVNSTQQSGSAQKLVMPASSANATLAEPIANAASRITKKPFGIYVSPGHSPVSPEKFTGYHTGTDFETLPSEQNIDVPIMAICSGTLKTRGWASGYGGYAVQNCTIDNQAVTVIYGHLRQSSINELPGQQLAAGQQIAVLGTGYSNETDGERKHLHLGIHKGADLNIQGYVQNKADLSGWIDWQTLK